MLIAMFRSDQHAADWLSGIIDGEGYVAARGALHRVREVRITNTDLGILDGVDLACERLGIGCYRRDRSERERLGSKPLFDIIISRRENVERLAQVVTLQSEKGQRLRDVVASYTRYGVLPPREEFEAVLREQGQRRAAAHYGVSQGTIWNWRRKLGVVPNPSGGKRKVA